MRGRVRVDRFAALPRVAVVGLIGGLASACSSETVRFADPFSNPFSTGQQQTAAARPPSDPMPTGSIAAPAGRVESQPLAPIAARPVAPVAPVAATAPAPAATARPAAPAGQAGWTAYGGTPVVVGQGESLNTIANRYNVPASAILQANGLANAGQVTAGRQVIIPVYNAVNATPVARPAAPAPVATAKPAPTQTTYRLVQGAKPAETKNATLADAKRVAAEKKVAEEAPVRTRPGMAAVKPVEKVAEKPKAAEKTAPVQAAQVQPLKAAQPVEKAPEPKRQVAAVPVAPVQPVETAKPAPKEPESTASLPQQAAAPAPETDFRWPARGRVIQGFGGASGNEGINIAVPEGTPVKAAGDGTVAYAGEELKGYGKLVLIRHDNGYVSAYAHNGELNVKRGDKVKRGQAVAKSGQTGNVNAPQLHFEIRKGSTPVDPMPYLAN